MSTVIRAAAIRVLTLDHMPVPQPPPLSRSTGDPRRFLGHGQQVAAVLTGIRYGRAGVAAPKVMNSWLSFSRT
jgi:hypothetical protein